MSNTNTPKNGLAKGVLFLTFSNLLFVAVGYLTNIFLGRYLGPSLYGIYGVLTSLLTALNIMQVSGVPQAVSKFIAEDEKRSDSILKGGFKIQIASTLVLGFIFFSLATTFAAIFHDSRFIGYTRVMALVFPFYGLFALYLGFYNGFHNFKRQAIMNAVYSLTKLLLVVGLVMVFSLYGVIAGFVIAPLLATLIGFHWPKSTKTFPVSRLIIFSIPLIGYAVFATMQLSIDLFSVKALLHNANSAGYYAAAQNIALITFFSMSALGQVLFPHISRLKSANKKVEVQKVISNSLRNLLLLLLPLTALIVGSAPSLIRLLFGDDYLPAVPTLRILVTSYIFLTIFAMFANILNGAGKAKTTTLLAAMGLITGFVGCLILIPVSGTTGAATATGIGGLLVATGAMWITKTQFRYSISLISTTRILIGALAVLTISWCVQVPPIFLPLWWIVVGLLYIVMMVLSKELLRDDWQEIRKLAPSRFERRAVK